MTTVRRHAIHRLQEQTLDTFDEIFCDGTLGEMSEKARHLVEAYPDSTVRELLQYGVQDGLYDHEDHNLIAPRLTGLVAAGVINRPKKRPCSSSDSNTKVYVHRLAPESWRQHIQYLRNTGKKNFVRNYIETPSKSRPGKVHTTIEWTDGAISCTCQDEYRRPTENRCHHALGMLRAATGKDPHKDAYNRLLKKYEALQKDHEELKEHVREYEELFR